VGARGELKKQLRLVERIGGIKRFDDAAVEELRRELRQPESAGKPVAVQKSAPAAMTNQAAFEQYRRLLESQLKRPPSMPPEVNEWIAATMNFSEWASRYLQRMRAVNGSNGKLGDAAVQPALVARQHALDATAPEMPLWHSDARQVIELAFSNGHMGFDVKAIEHLHGYGPSLRRLWAEARSRGADDGQAWAAIREWARHRPAVWEAEDKRKKKGQAYSVPALGEHLAREVAWSASGDPLHPWAADVADARWRVRVNDFPDDLMYTLVIGETEIGSFHDWPETWRRP
jgi:hypothetical protein